MVSSTFASPSSSTVDSAPTSSSEQGVSSTIGTSISVSSTASSEISSETSVSAQPVVLPETATFSSGEASATGPTSSTTDADKQAWLDGHNTLRQQHGASALTWSDTLASAAQSWANGCVFEHSGGQYGENLYAGTGNVGPSNAVSAWAAEASDYDSSNPTYSHFTQMVWKSTTELGCALALCDGIFDASYGKASFYVCEYNPPGNVIGQFAENVQA
ncbi:hypothetical protein ACEPAI_6031 [Sanghuangporus weigelae]